MPIKLPWARTMLHHAFERTFSFCSPLKLALATALNFQKRQIRPIFCRSWSSFEWCNFIIRGPLVSKIWFRASLWEKNAVHRQLITKSAFTDIWSLTIYLKRICVLVEMKLPRKMKTRFHQSYLHPWLLWKMLGREKTNRYVVMTISFMGPCTYLVPVTVIRRNSIPHIYV